MNFLTKIRQEITEYAKERVQEIHDHNPDKLNEISDLHHEIFNADYYIIGYYQARVWMGDNAFDCIGAVQDYEQENFGEVHTDLSCPEKVANMYAYIIGEEVLSDVVKEFKDNLQLELELEEPSCVVFNSIRCSSILVKYYYKLFLCVLGWLAQHIRIELSCFSQLIAVSNISYLSIF